VVGRITEVWRTHSTDVGPNGHADALRFTGTNRGAGKLMPTQDKTLFDVVFRSIYPEVCR